MAHISESEQEYVADFIKDLLENPNYDLSANQEKVQRVFRILHIDPYELEDYTGLKWDDSLYPAYDNTDTFCDFLVDLREHYALIQKQMYT